MASSETPGFQRYPHCGQRSHTATVARGRRWLRMPFLFTMVFCSITITKPSFERRGEMIYAFMLCGVPFKIYFRRSRASAQARLPARASAHISLIRI
ncbi:hypothetical protein FA95DRAFT_1559511 [Auriscalpium vulgare]|uniref:Uncharacterized protein n=1 Tax=Auriscalpium vulgare TaxID=40419 RepID=A0ACB8RTV3_9AGAM|nr:hypothetical protein FA95DRAFT_1559511 [Auriscalpium vulgare]